MRFKKGDIWTCDLTNAVGAEQSGIRPVVIIQNDKGNMFSPTTIVASITSKTKKNSLPTHLDIENDRLRTKSTILLEQVKTVDKNLLGDKIGSLTKEQMKELNKCIIASFDL